MKQNPRDLNCSKLEDIVFTNNLMASLYLVSLKTRKTRMRRMARITANESTWLVLFSSAKVR